MTVSTRTRRSKFLLDFSPLRDGLSVNGAPLAVSSGKLVAGTFDRGGTVNTAYEMDAFGYFTAPGYKMPRFTHRYNSATGLIEPAGMLLEGIRAPVELGSCSFGDTTYWANSSSLYTLAGAISCFRGQTATKHTNTGGSAARSQNLGTFVNGQTDCLFAIIEQGTGATCSVNIFDGTASATLGAAVLTWATMAVNVSALASGGVITLAATGPNGGKLVLLWVAATGTASGTGAAGNTRRPLCNVTTNGDSAYAYLHHMQFTAAVGSPSSPIVNVGSAQTRSADQLSFNLNAPPAAMSIYVDLIDFGTSKASVTRVFQITDADSNINSVLLATNPGLYFFNMSDAGGSDVSSSSASVAPSFGDRVELLATISAAGSTRITQAINGGSAIVASAGAAAGLPAAWGSGGQVKLVIGAKWPGSLTGFSAFRCVRVASGVQTIGYMRAG